MIHKTYIDASIHQTCLQVLVDLFLHFLKLHQI